MAITSATLQRTFRVRFGSQCGTCFTIDMDDRRYLVTARHLANSVQGAGEIEVWHDGTWKRLAVELAGHGTGDIDVSVLAPQQLFGGGYPITPHDGFRLGDNVHFLGFPFGMGSEVGGMNSDFPIPWIKRAIVSAINSADGILFLDGHNNPGFSGGPVVRDDVSDVQILGVVSGYRRERQPVLDIGGQKGPYTYDLNTGIVVAYDMRHIRQIVSNNPIGLSVR